MSLSVPTTQETSDSIIAGLEASLSETIPLLPKAFSRVLAKVLAGVFVLLYKYSGFIFLQMFVAHATMQETTINGKVVRPLVEWGRLFGVGDPFDAVRAEHTVTVVVENQSGATLPAGTLLVRKETEVLYQTTTPVTLNAATVDVVVRANLDHAGTVGNLTNGDTLSFINPLGDVATDATVLNQIVAGSDEELESAYRSRVFSIVQLPPQGGAYSDYRTWARTVPGIVTAYPYTGSTPNEVDVYIEATVASSGSEDGVPTDSQMLAVQSAINLNTNGKATRRPVGAAVRVLPISRRSYDITITGLIADDADAVQSTINAGVDEFLRSREPYIEGLSVLPRLNRITVGEVAGVAHGLAHASGASIEDVSLSFAGVEFSTSTLINGQRAKLGTSTYL